MTEYNLWIFQYFLIIRKVSISRVIGEFLPWFSDIHWFCFAIKLCSFKWTTSTLTRHLINTCIRKFHLQFFSNFSPIVNVTKPLIIIYTNFVMLKISNLSLLNTILHNLSINQQLFDGKTLPIKNYFHNCFLLNLNYFFPALIYDLIYLQRSQKGF